MESAAAPKPEKAAAAVAPGLEVYLPLAGMIDIGKEIERLRRELDGLQAEAAKVRAKLGNESFVAKAPPQVVQKQRDRLADLEDQLTKVQVRVAQLES
jgi:valyl-tRNA synthetase